VSYKATKLGGLKALDKDQWTWLMQRAFEDGRTAKEAIVWLRENDYGDVSLRQIRRATAEWQEEQGKSIFTEKPPEPPPKGPCKACRGFGRVDRDGKPTLRRAVPVCKVCDGRGYNR
jgi:hypothetical protein